MKTVFGAFAISVLVVACSTVAQAATLFTQPLVGQTFACLSANVSRETRQITIEILDSVGEVVHQSSSILSPLAVETIFFAGFERPDYVVCRITVQGSKKNVRGTLCITDDNGVCSVAVPAQ